MFSGTSSTWKSTTLRITTALATLAMVVMVAWVAVASSLGHVVVDSDPPGAKVIVGSQVVGTTPATLQLPADTPVRVKIQKAGYKSRSLTLTPSADKTTRVTVRLKQE